MKVIQRGRGGGKTTEIVAAFRAHGMGYLVVPSEPERERIVRIYQLTEDEQRRTLVSKADALKGIHAEVFADNLDWIISMFLGSAVDVASVNGQPSPSPVEAGLRAKAQKLVDVLGARHHGRMPDEVQAAYDGLLASLTSPEAPPTP